MLPEIMDCQRCGATFELNNEERTSGIFKCSMCGNLNLFQVANQSAVKNVFQIKDQIKFTCSVCGQETDSISKSCSKCGAVFANAINTGSNPGFTNPQQPNMHKTYRLSFTGEAGEYFKIWIVNLLLTIFTLGIYAAWAKVRTRKYFYNNTWLDDQHFDYRANPKGILIGYLILGVLIFLYYSTQFFNPFIPFVILFIGALIFPYLVYKSYRFMAHNSSYRNLRFRFTGGVGDSYITYLLIPLGIPFTLGILFPFWEYYRKYYSNNNFGFGNLRSRFSGQAGTFYKYYIIIGVIMFASMIGIILSIGFAMTMIGDNIDISSGFGFFIMYLIVLMIYQIALIIFRQYIYARLTNYTLQNTNFGNVKFNSKLRFSELLSIQVSNLFAIVFSLGMLIPWAKIRRTKYIMDKISVHTDLDLNNIQALTDQENNAFGEVTTEYFELNIGL